MYSPKISEMLIPRIYRAAKAAKIPMTRWVDQAIENALPAGVEGEGESEINDNIAQPVATATASTE